MRPYMYVLHCNFHDKSTFPSGHRIHYDYMYTPARPYSQSSQLWPHPMLLRAVALAVALETIAQTSGIVVDVAQASGVDVSGAELCDASAVIRDPDPCVGHRCDPVTGVPCPVRAPSAAPLHEPGTGMLRAKFNR